MKLIVFLLAFTAVIGAQNAHAGSKVVPTEPPKVEPVTTDPNFEYIDIHDRRFAYKDSFDVLKQEIDVRRENYNAPNQQALKAYETKLEEKYKASGKPPAPSAP
jgi:hypothetical protein